MELAIINGTYRDTKALGPGGVPGGPSPARKSACRFGPHASPHCWHVGGDASWLSVAASSPFFPAAVALSTFYPAEALGWQPALAPVLCVSASHHRRVLSLIHLLCLCDLSGTWTWYAMHSCYACLQWMLPPCFLLQSISLWRSSRHDVFIFCCSRGCAMWFGSCVIQSWPYSFCMCVCLCVWGHVCVRAHIT